MNMLKINNQQFEVFEHKSKRLFIKECVPFLKENSPEFTKDKSNDEIEIFIIETIKFSESQKIMEKVNVKRIMLLKIEHDFSYKLNIELKYTLSGTSFSENYRVAKFRKALRAKNKLVSINLDTDI